MDATCGRRVFSSAETPCNFIIYANERKVTTKLLLNSRNFLWVSLCYKHTIKKTNEHFERLSDKETPLGCALSLCDSSQYFAVSLWWNGRTAWFYCQIPDGVVVKSFLFFFSSLLLFHIFLRITCKCITGVGHCI